MNYFRENNNENENFSFQKNKKFINLPEIVNKLNQMS